MKISLFNHLVLVFLFLSCTTTKIVTLKLEPQNNEVFTTQVLKDYLKSNMNPSIVLRVPKIAENSTEEEISKNSLIYNVIEKELLKAGFQVRDRALFMEVLSRTQETDYNKIQQSTKTDLILELININLRVEHITNKYYNKNNESKIFLNNENHSLYGVSLEFKIILIKNNQFVGSYRFNYTPCTEGCRYKYSFDQFTQNGYLKPYENSNSDRAFEIIANDELENFVRDGINKLIGSIK